MFCNLGKSWQVMFCVLHIKIASFLERKRTSFPRPRIRVNAVRGWRDIFSRCSVMFCLDLDLSYCYLDTYAVAER